MHTCCLLYHISLGSWTAAFLDFLALSLWINIRKIGKRRTIIKQVISPHMPDIFPLSFILWVNFGAEFMNKPGRAEWLLAGDDSKSNHPHVTVSGAILCEYSRKTNEFLILSNSCLAECRVASSTGKTKGDDSFYRSDLSGRKRGGARTLSDQSTDIEAGKLPWSDSIRPARRGRNNGESETEIVAECTALKKAPAVRRTWLVPGAKEPRSRAWSAQLPGAVNLWRSRESQALEVGEKGIRQNPLTRTRTTSRLPLSHTRAFLCCFSPIIDTPSSLNRYRQSYSGIKKRVDNSKHHPTLYRIGDFAGVCFSRILNFANRTNSSTRQVWTLIIILRLTGKGCSFGDRLMIDLGFDENWPELGFYRFVQRTKVR